MSRCCQRRAATGLVVFVGCAVAQSSILPLPDTTCHPTFSEETPISLSQSGQRIPRQSRRIDCAGSAVAGRSEGKTSRTRADRRRSSGQTFDLTRFYRDTILIGKRCLICPNPMRFSSWPNFAMKLGAFCNLASKPQWLQACSHNSISFCCRSPELPTVPWLRSPTSPMYWGFGTIRLSSLASGASWRVSFAEPTTSAIADAWC
jgi:hypothetical protein